MIRSIYITFQNISAKIVELGFVCCESFNDVLAIALINDSSLMSVNSLYIALDPLLAQ